ncbi:hypothetical protein HHI36_014305 [Cryptolaemus montrouzieri]|uniref:Uncharacterized protein n=1 Tax=Cryptolaemus montrouzieri TaxID=559131 RepID=A0ABD2N2E9_9CUCU
MFKRGKPFVSSSAIAVQLLNYTNKMQKLDFCLTVMQTRTVSYSPGEKPIRYNFMTTFSRAYTPALDSRGIVRNAFKKASTFPIDYNAIPDAAVAPSLVTASKDANITERRTVKPCETLEKIVA